MTGEAGDRSDRSTLLHVDMDAFFVSVTIRDRPELHGRPVIVGGGARGVVLSASYEARRCGVRSAMPMTRAWRLCPTAVVLPAAYPEIEASSAAVRELLLQVTPMVEMMSVDEAFVDVAGALRRFASPVDVAEHVRARVHDEQRITCSVGIGPTRSVAKLAGRRAKPDGVVRVPADAVVDFLHPLDVGELWGVGERSRQRLESLGVRTVADLAHLPLPELCRAVGPRAGTHLHALAWGTDSCRVSPHPVSPAGAARPSERSIGSQATFGHDTDDTTLVRRELLRRSAAVARRARAAGLVARTVALTVRFADFTTLTRSRTLADPTDVTTTVHATACELYSALGLRRTRVRLVGVRLEGLQRRDGVHEQLVLGAREHGWADADRASDRAVRRFGRYAVRPASLLREDRP
ncbi:DNA polymerase IV [Marmoricola endophyticus]|uniref:DNA polymerase IV n=1 Tax=Marmoricola endophyticus TaxID=2040280 RepID=A0A917F2D6_9ACTN|nr:DNA polymerase IV [Marmoricola endophyticus]GGF38033.1 DNA polymerase IV [Marmoricola endophyticus]